MPLQATSGAASYDAFGGGVAAVPNYIEDVFSTYLYTGNGSTQTITNSIDLSGKGGLVWLKARNAQDFGNLRNHWLFDSARTAGYGLYTNSTSAQSSAFAGSIPFNSTGFSINTGDDNLNGVTTTGGSAYTYTSWTFRKQPKFFDVVTYTGTGSATTIAHNLGSVPGCIMVKRTDAAGEWRVWHRGLSNSATNSIYLNRSDAETGTTTIWNSTDPTSTVFSLGNSSATNGSGATYVAYLFAHNAGGFGLTGTDNVISCGSFTTDGSANATVNLGYEPQWVMIKSSSNTGNWFVVDNMRNFSRTVTASLSPNLSNAELAGFGDATYSFFPTATGFQSVQDLAASQTYIYVAIRRGPMKVPTSGASVYNAVARTGTGAVAQVTGVGFSPDFSLTGVRSGSPYNGTLYDKLRGAGYRIGTRTTAAEGYDNDTLTSFNMNGVSLGADNFGYINTSGGIDYINWYMKRAPSFFDEVCYTGTGADPQTVPHNLGKAPELMIFKARAVGAGWRIWGGNMAITEYLALNEDSAVVTGPAFFGGTLPTATSFYVGSGLSVSARTHVAYLFATAAGVSKVFSYTGNGSSQTINCGFTGGARFVLIKRTDDVGDWYVWDSARGIVSGNDPHLSLNTTAAEVTTDDTIDTDSTGFVVNQVSATNVNVSSATYIGLAIA